MGFGLESLVAVSCDDYGRMIPQALEHAILSCIKEGAAPVMVNATCGTTVYGAYDPLDDIAEVCKRHQVVCKRHQVVYGTYGPHNYFGEVYKKHQLNYHPHYSEQA